MYDYVVHKELENTETVYHCHLDHSTNGKATRGLTKARDLFKGKDVLLLDKDIANWYPKGWICEPVKLEEVSYHLGPLTRAVTCVPPKPLLDHITNAEEISGASTARRIIDPPLIVEARVTEKDELTKERDGEECMVDQGECSWIVLEEVTRLGADTSHGLKVGDRVCALIAQGAWFTFTRLHWTGAAKIPDSMRFEAAASIPMAFVTAYYCLFDVARLCEGERVLIHAGSGGVGQVAVILAKYVGAEIFTTVFNREETFPC